MMNGRFERCAWPLRKLLWVRSILCNNLCAQAPLLVLKALHFAGWVHRDISSGNILLWNNHVKLADLEFAKRFTEMQSAVDLENVRFHNVRTVSDNSTPLGTMELIPKQGTPRYASLEAAVRRFLFVGIADPTLKPPKGIPVQAGVPLSKQKIDFSVKPVDDGEEHAPINDISRPNPPSRSNLPKIIWQYHPLHDVESLSWLSDDLTLNRDLYFAPVEYPDRDVYAPEGGETIDERHERIKRQARAAENLHPSNALSRSRCMTTPGILAELLEDMHPILRKDPPGKGACSVAAALVEIRDCIHRTYVTSSVDPSKITNFVADEVYSTMSEALTKASNSLLMPNYIPSIRPLEKEVHAVRKQDGVKDIVQKTTGTKKSKGKAKEVSQATKSEVNAAGKRKRETSTRGTDPQPGSSKDQDPPEDTQIPTQATKKRKTTARKPTTRKTTAKSKS